MLAQADTAMANARDVMRWGIIIEELNPLCYDQDLYTRFDLDAYCNHSLQLLRHLRISPVTFLPTQGI